MIIKENLRCALISLLSFMMVFSSCTEEESGSDGPGNSNSSIIFNPDLSYGTMTDQDGNTYKTIKIGEQTWMAENLRTTKLNDGTEITKTIITPQWNSANSSAPQYFSINNTTKTDSIKTFGLFYNWYAVNTGKLAPTGWHIPSKEEWKTLFTNLGGTSSASNKMKEVGTTHWAGPNANATNASGFTAIPSGYMYDIGRSFTHFTYSANFWTTIEYSNNTSKAYGIELHYQSDIVGTENTFYKPSGFSIRCIKD